MRYVIGSGWWCSQPGGTARREFGLQKVGHPVIRGKKFFDMWLYFVRRYTDPVKIVVVDSASPILPAGAHTNPGYEFISLDRNYHSVPKTPYNGWIRGFMAGAWYAWNCDAHFIYVEQDCLVIGKDWVDVLAKAAGGRKPLFGSRFRSPIQQSLVFLPYACIPRFLYLLTSFKNSMTCETRFHETSKVKHGMGYGILPFGVGRVRPIDWTARHLYAQHWSDEELVQLGKREGVNGMIQNLLEGDSHEGGSVRADPAQQHPASG
jgi:hypothetical protein